MVWSKSTFCQIQTVGLFVNDSLSFNGYTLFSPLSSKETYLIDNCGYKINQWSSDYIPGMLAYLLEDGSLLRAGRSTSGFGTGGAGGIIEHKTWDDKLVWRYEYSTDSVKHHHDFEYLPNGNILLIAWEKISSEKIIQAGRNPNSLSGTDLWLEQIIELKPVGNDQAEIVWKWHVFDHLVQEQDAQLDNFGNIREQNQLFNINYNAFSSQNPSQPGNRDWLHFNAIDYNSELDQILFSSRNFNEIFIIDHSTTTEEAASHSGGNSGMGGDILFRWGNPAAYRNGNEEDQLLFSQHDSEWEKQNGQYTGEISIFNNGLGRDNLSSTIEIIKPIRNNNNHYVKNSDGNFEIEEDPITIDVENTFNFTSPRLSSVEILDNENVLIAAGNQGTIYEITKSGELVWKYINPISNSVPIPQGETPNSNDIFRAFRYAPDYPAFNGKDLIPGDLIETEPLPSDCQIFDIPTRVNDLAFFDVTLFPNPITDILNIKMESERLTGIELVDVLGRKIIKLKKITQPKLDLSGLSSGIYYLKLQVKNQFKTFKIYKN